MFKKIKYFRIQHQNNLTPEELEPMLDGSRYVECGATQEKSCGWIEPRGVEHGPLVESIDGQLIMKFMMEVKKVPSKVLTRKVDEKCKAIEADLGRKVGKKEKREIADDLRLQLLPMSFATQSSALVWINREANMLVIEAGSQGAADEIITLLIKNIAGLIVNAVNTKTSPTSAMSEWLLTLEAPAGFTADRSCVLKATIKYDRHPLDTEEVQDHIKAGKLPISLAMTWEGRISYVLSETGTLSKVEFLDVVFDGANRDKGDAFDADLTIATCELKKMIPDLISALGGEEVIAA